MKCMNSSTVTSKRVFVDGRLAEFVWDAFSQVEPGVQHPRDSSTSKPSLPDSSVSNLLKIANQLPSLTPSRPC